MFTDEQDLKSQVRQYTGYTSTLVLSDDGLDNAYRNAKRLIQRKKSLADDFDWFSTDNLAAQDALYYFTALHTKVTLGELDSQDLQAGAVDQKALLAKDGDDVTEWYRNAYCALSDVKASNIFQAGEPARTDREYESDTFSDQSGGGNTGNSNDL